MPSTFLPGRDQDLNAWASNFDQKITASPTVYGLVAADATAFHALALDYDTRLTTATNPATRTRSTIEAKNISRGALRAKARALAKIVNAFPATTNVTRADLGLTIRDTTPSPVPSPVTRPVLTVDAFGNLNMADELTPTSRRKPPGVIGAHLFTKVGAVAPASIDDCRFAGLATRNRFALALPADSTGQTLWVLARWCNERGEDGPVSNPASTKIAA